MADLNPARSPVHPGIDAQSWLGFEQRVQARRFDALITSARGALVKGDITLAEHALSEARELRPNAPQVAELQAELRRMLPPDGPRLWRRAIGGAALLAVGVAMVVSLDAIRIARDALPRIAPPPPLPAGTMFKSGAALDVPVAVEPVAPIKPDVVRSVSADAEDVAAPVAERPAPTVASLPHTIAPPDRRQTNTAHLNATAEVPTRMSNGADVVRQVASTPAPVPPPVFLTATTPGVRSTLPPVVAPTPARAGRVEDTGAEEHSRVADVLRRYAHAYGALDVRAAIEVWPGVDQQALTRAFEGLASQTVSFDDCQIDVQGVTANASCRGQASYVGKVGRGEPRTEPRTWRFELRRDGDTWKIENAEARRTSG